MDEDIMSSLDWDPAFFEELLHDDFDEEVSLLDMSMDEDILLEVVEKIEREIYSPIVEDISVDSY